MNNQKNFYHSDYFFTFSEIWKLLAIVLIFTLILIAIYKLLKKFFYPLNNIVIARFNVPKNHRAITMGYIIDGKLHNTDIAGAIVQLYQEHYLDIVYEKDSQSFFAKNWIIQNYFPNLIKKNWVIKRTPKKDFNLIKSEQLVLKYLFPEKENPLEPSVIKLSDIKYRKDNYKIFQEIEKEVIYEVQKFKYLYRNKNINFVKKYSKILIFWISSIVLTLLFFNITYLKSYNYFSLFLIFMTLNLSILFYFFKKIDQLTATTKDGDDILNRIKGYKMYLKTVFKDRTNFFDILEKNRDQLSKELPYMISFNINHRFDKLVNSLEYRSKEEKERRYFFKSILMWPIVIIFSLFFTYLYLKYNNVF